MPLESLLKEFLTLSNVFNIPATNSFADVLAKKLLADYAEHPLELAKVTLLLPSRRACKSMAEAFVREKGLVPTLLPKMVPLGDVEEDELILSGDGGGEVLHHMCPAIERAERLMLFTKIIMAKPGEFGIEKMPLGQACYLAQELANLIDTIHHEGLDFSNLSRLVPEEYAAHWQETLKFLEIITRYWPAILKERGMSDASERRNFLLRAQAEIWARNPLEGRLIIAATTATFPAMKELVKTVLGLENGELILNGLDRCLEKSAWAEIDESHPQFELKQLLDFLEIDRESVIDLTLAENSGREKLISEIMRPAKTTDEWRRLAEVSLRPEAVSGLTLVNCRDIREEALAIALIMRETLETPEKTAALVTPDRQLARRVSAELERWDIKIDDSAGRPLAQTPPGAFLRLVIRAALPGAGRIDWLSLLKHPLCGMGGTYGEIRSRIRKLEQKVWRGGAEDQEAERIMEEMQDCLGGLREICVRPKVNLSDLLVEHVRAAERLAANSEKGGEQILWRGDAGEAAARFLAEWYAKAEVLGDIETAEYLGLWEAMAAGVTVRPKYGMHPRLKILGPIEARLSHADVMIIGEVNEGIWPAAGKADPWLSRPMKKDFGFPLPEKAAGVLGLDFSTLLGSREVFLTRAERVQGTPMVKSRWWMRLETVLKALGHSAEHFEDVLYQMAAAGIDVPAAMQKVEAPSPRPPVSARPRELSASAIELLMRDPYSVFAKYILRLKPLNEIEPDLTMADYGTIIHGILEKFNNLYPQELPNDALEKLLAIGRASFTDNHLALERRAFWWPAFEKIAGHLIEVEQTYRKGIRRIFNEVRGSFCFEAPAGEFTVTAKADRIDLTRDGKVNIIDYKTGKVRSVKEVCAGYAPQLPIEGLIAQRGGFVNLGSTEVEKLIYWQLGKKEVEISENITEILEDNAAHLKELIHIFDFETTAYICHPNPKHIPEYSDYEHLARVREWSVESGEDS